MEAVQRKQRFELKRPDRTRVVSLLVDVSNYDTAVRQIAALAKNGGGYVCVSTVHMVMEAFYDEKFGEIVNSADIVVPDGMPLVWMQKLQGVKTADRVRGPSLMPRLLSFAEKHDLSVGFYGGSPKTLENIIERTGAEHPDLRVAYGFSPPFRRLSESEEADITTAINESKPDILFVGLGCPKQERWMSANRDKTSAVMIGVGAAFDYYAREITESPVWLQNIGLEWLYRLTRQPRKLWKRYLFLNPVFIWLAAMQLLGLRKFE